MQWNAKNFNFNNFIRFNYLLRQWKINFLSSFLFLTFVRGLKSFLRLNSFCLLNILISLFLNIHINFMSYFCHLKWDVEAWHVRYTNKVSSLMYLFIAIDIWGRGWQGQSLNFHKKTFLGKNDYINEYDYVCIYLVEFG